MKELSSRKISGRQRTISTVTDPLILAPAAVGEPSPAATRAAEQARTLRRDAGRRLRVRVRVRVGRYIDDHLTRML